MLLGGNLVTWRSKKQMLLLGIDSTEAEFRAMAHGVCELLWLRIILKDLKVACEEFMILHCVVWESDCVVWDFEDSYFFPVKCG